MVLKSALMRDFSGHFPQTPRGSRKGIVIAEPFGPVVPEVPLPSAPLVFVVAQARFERVASILSEEFIAGFQEAIRGSYPKMRREQQTAVLIGPDGRLLTTDAGTVWRFDEHPERWQVALSPDSVALSTASYTSRSDFIARLRAVLSAAQRHLGLQFCDRLGVRYIDRVTDDGLLTRLADLIKPEVRGPVGAALGEAGVEQLLCWKRPWPQSGCRTPRRGCLDLQ